MTISVVPMVAGFHLALGLIMATVGAAAFTRRRYAPESTLVSLLTGAAGWYCFVYAMELTQVSFDAARFWLHLEYLATPWIPTLWLVLARRHFGLSTRTRLLYAFPVLYTLAEWTNDLHHLHDRALQFARSGPFWLVQFDRGPIAWTFLAYIYGVQLYTVFLCLSRFLAASGQERRRIGYFAAASLPGCVGYTVYLLGLSPWGLDLTPVTLSLTVLIGYATAFRLECFNVMPVARWLVFKSMRDAVLVTDLRHRVVDFNPAACALFPSLGKDKLGRDVAVLFPAGQGALGSDWGQEGTQQMQFEVDGQEQLFQVSFFPLEAASQQVGWAIILADITAQAELVRELERTAGTDSLTGVANRRAFDHAMDRECARAARYDSPFALILIDIDHFKSINDQGGHSLGDDVLRRVACRIGTCLRATDLLARYGGDEFAALLPETDLPRAEEVAERIRTAVEHAENDDAESARVTLSIGLSAFVAGARVDPQFLFRQADEALYSAKQKGRNRVATWPGLSVLPTPPTRRQYSAEQAPPQADIR